jgi:nanoRNase/pAp phosphatase (c-di-AMP/oligoRNAs hydrolase)
MQNGSEIENNWSKIYHFNLGELKSMSLFMMNLTTVSSYNYSYITDEQVEKLKAEGVSWEDLSNGYYMFVDLFLKYTGLSKWGFVILPEYDNKNKYRVSLRSIDDIFDTSLIATKFNGGGHKSASGCSVTAEDYLKAISSIEDYADLI